MHNDLSPVMDNILPSPHLVAALLNLPSVRRGLDPLAQEVESVLPGCGPDTLEALGFLGRLLRRSLQDDAEADGLTAGLNRILSSCPVTYALSGRALDISAARADDEAKLPAFRLALRVAESIQTGEWGRMKQCAGCSCVFYDTSRNGKRVWCSMETCGNRAKVNRWRGKQNASVAQASSEGCECGGQCCCEAHTGELRVAAYGGVR